jgi:hypothetical protein
MPAPLTAQRPRRRQTIAGGRPGRIAEGCGRGEHDPRASGCYQEARDVQRAVRTRWYDMVSFFHLAGPTGHAVSSPFLAVPLSIALLSGPLLRLRALA